MYSIERKENEMKILCKTEGFIKALERLIKLLSRENLNKKGVDENLKGIKEIKSFLMCVLNYLKSDALSSYEGLIGRLERFGVSDMKNCGLEPKDFKNLLSYMGMLLDAIQILKPYTDRYKKIENSLRKALRRTGHEFVLDFFERNNREEVESILNEIRNTVATLILLEIIVRVYHEESNPIISLRRSMGDRYPEEYFSEMMAGWMAEKYFQKLLKTLTVQREGVDKDFNIFLTKPGKMGGADFEIDGKKVELQRSSKEKFKLKKQGENKLVITTPLKEHKLTNSDVIVLWIGENKLLDDKKCKKCDKSVFWFIKINPIVSLISLKGGRSKNFITNIPNSTSRNDANDYKKAHELVMEVNKQINDLLNSIKKNKDIWLMENLLNASNFGKNETRNFILNTCVLRRKLISFKSEYKVVKNDSVVSRRSFFVKKENDLKAIYKLIVELKRSLEKLATFINENNFIKLSSENDVITLTMKRDEFFKFLVCEEELTERIKDILS